MSSTATALLVAVLCAWLLSGPVCSFVMARRGHDAWTWAVLGVLLGPLVFTLALRAIRRERATGPIARVLHVGRAGPGSISVLVGVDGSAESLAAVRGVVDLLGPRLGRLTLATVIDYDAADLSFARDENYVQAARQVLEDAARAVREMDPYTVVLIGRPADALAHYARDNGHDVVAVGARGRGADTAVVGSVAEELVRRPDVVVLVAAATSDPVSTA